MVVIVRSTGPLSLCAAHAGGPGGGALRGGGAERSVYLAGCSSVNERLVGRMGGEGCGRAGGSALRLGCDADDARSRASLIRKSKCRAGPLVKPAPSMARSLLPGQLCDRERHPGRCQNHRNDVESEGSEGNPLWSSLRSDATRMAVVMPSGVSALLCPVVSRSVHTSAGAAPALPVVI